MSMRSIHDTNMPQAAALQQFQTMNFSSFTVCRWWILYSPVLQCSWLFRISCLFWIRYWMFLSANVCVLQNQLQGKAMNSKIFYEFTVPLILPWYCCLRHIGMIIRYQTYVFDLYTTGDITRVLSEVFTCVTRASDKKYIAVSQIVFSR